MRSEWDTPTLALAQAINELAGREVSMVDLKQAWQFYVGNDDHSFSKAIDRGVSLWPDHIQAVYVRSPGWYTEVRFKIVKALDYGLS